MKKYYFPIIIYTILMVISLGYAGMAFIDTDLSCFVSDFDPFKLIMGLGCALICAHVIHNYIRLSK